MTRDTVTGADRDQVFWDEDDQQSDRLARDVVLAARRQATSILEVPDRG
jgi:hypothetical protein